MRRPSPWQLALIAAAALLLVAGLMSSSAGAGMADESGHLALSLAIVVTAALIGGHIAVRLGQAAVLGELLVGVALGNLPGLGLIQFIGTDPFIDILARVGMLLLMFEVGLDLSVRDLFAVGSSSLLVAVLGTVGSLAAGIAAATLAMPSSASATHIFLGAAITATSVGITARVLKDVGSARSDEARVILGAAVVDDILGLIVLGVVVAAFGRGHGPEAIGMRPTAALVMKTIGFLVLAILLGVRLTPAWFRQAARLRTEGALLAIGLCFCFFLSWAASAIGLASLVGAFAAGLVLEDAHSETFVQRGERPLGELLRPMTSFLVPVFFVLVGFRASVRSFANPALLGLPLALAAAAVLGKLACALGVVHRSVSRATVAIGMIPRGEVALVFAALGRTLTAGEAPLLDERGYAAIVAVVVLTTLATPPALKWSLGKAGGRRTVTRPAA